MLATELAALYARDIARLIQELRAFPDTATLWQTLPGVTNPAGNLALHLEGNLREYIGRQLGKVDYARERPLEFSQKDTDKDELVARLEEVHALVPRVVGGLSEEALATPYPEPFYGSSVSTQQFLIHLNGHLNYHLGQIDYLRRALTGDGAIALTGL